MLPSEISVLIIGGGGSGLTSSILLSDLGIESLLVERRSSTSHMPKAGAHNQRTMEIFRRHGVAEQIHEIGAPAENRMRAAWYTSLGGEGETDRRFLYSIDLNGEGTYRDLYEKDSPELSAGLGQYLLEPLLRKNATERNPGRVCFHHELVSLVQDGQGVLAEIRDRDTDMVHKVRARYVIAADGGRTVAPLLGLEMTGPTDLAEMMSIYYRADLSSYVEDDVMAYWFVGGQFGTWAGGSMVKAGPDHWDRHSETWTVHFMVQPGEAATYTKETALPRLQRLLNIPDLDAEILGVSPWRIEGVHLERSREGNIFFIGDAAHRQPPTSGLGLQSAIQDADNLTWKLAAVLKGWAGEAILDTYEAERRPVIQQNIDYALFAFQNQFAFEAGMGLTRARNTEERLEALRQYFAPTAMGETLRARAAEVFNTVRLELNPHDREIGFRYDEGLLIPDGTEPPPRDPMGVIYTPATRPGHRLPHAWLNKRGKRVSTHDLGGIGSFILLTDGKGQNWCDAAARLSAETGVPIEAVRISADGDYGDPKRSWLALREIGEGGALLVRPDRYVACRYPEPASDAYAALKASFDELLGPVPVAAVGGSQETCSVAA